MSNETYRLHQLLLTKLQPCVRIKKKCTIFEVKKMLMDQLAESWTRLNNQQVT